jgi:alpha-glucosidase
MKKSVMLLLVIIGAIANAQTITVKSPDNNIVITISNNEKLIYSVTYNGRNIVNPSQLGFEFKDELPMTGNFTILD